MLKNDDMINVYNDYDNKIFAPSVDPRGNDLIFPPKTEDGEPYYVYLPFVEISQNVPVIGKSIQLCYEARS